MFNFTSALSKAASDGSYWFEIEVGPQPQTIEEYVRRLFAGVGLKMKAQLTPFAISWAAIFSRN